MNAVVAIVGMPGAGKTEATNFLETKGFRKIRFGGITIDEIKKKKLEVNEKNERSVREEIRKKHGMEAYAKLSSKTIDKLLREANVVVDGLYSYEEYIYMRKKYKDRLVVVSIYASPKTRYSRLSRRKERPLNKKDCEDRDRAQIENLRTGGPIAMADFTVVNECPLEEMYKALEESLKAAGV